MVLSCIKREGLKAKLGKCAFFQQQVRYLGHVVSSQGVATDPRKVVVVAQCQCPTSLFELRSFLGFVGYYHQFVEGFSRLAAPLHRLVAERGGRRPQDRAERNFANAWMAHCQESFKALNGKLVKAPILAYADFSLSFILEVEASYKGLGTVHSQEQEGKIKPIAYASRSLRPTECNTATYSSMKPRVFGTQVGHDGKIWGVFVRAQVYCVYR